MIGLIDPPGRYASKEQWDEFLQRIRSLPQDDPQVQAALNSAKAAEEFRARQANTAPEMEHPTITLALNSPDGDRRLSLAWAALHRDLNRNRFNRERAIQTFMIAIDNAVWSSIKGARYRAFEYAELKPLMRECAQNLADRFIIMNDASDQRPPRKWLRHLLGA